eukprot:10867-Heterococcus_DN1.PRE.4
MLLCLTPTLVGQHSSRTSINGYAAIQCDAFELLLFAPSLFLFLLRLPILAQQKNCIMEVVTRYCVFEDCSIFVTLQVCVCLVYQKVQKNCSRGNPFYQHAQQQFCAFKPTQFHDCKCVRSSATACGLIQSPMLHSLCLLSFKSL